MPSKQQNWNDRNPEKMKASYLKYNQKRPLWSFRPGAELITWLESQQQEGESKAELVRRLLIQLKEIS